MNKPRRTISGLRRSGFLFSVVFAAFPAGTRADVDSVVAAPDADSRSTLAADKALESVQDFPRFGVSIGAGMFSATGNRGALWASERPMYDLTVSYAVFPELAFDLEGFSAESHYNSSAENGGSVQVSIQHLEVGARYYGDLHTILPQVMPNWVTPFVTAGAGFYVMKKSSFAQSTEEPADTQLGLTLGAGIRFALIPQTFGVEFLGRWNSVNFQDTQSTDFKQSNGLDNLSGQFVSWNANMVVNF